MSTIPNGCSQVRNTGKKRYESPAVVTFGSVAKLTMGQNGTKADNGHSANTRKG